MCHQVRKSSAGCAMPDTKVCVHARIWWLGGILGMVTERLSAVSPAAAAWSASEDRSPKNALPQLARTFSIERMGGTHPRGGTEMCRFAAWECTPHFLWLRQRKRAVHGPKEKRFWCPTLPLWGKVGRTGVGGSMCHQVPEAFCQVRYTGYGGRSACPHLGAGAQMRGGRRKAFTAGPVCSASLHTTWAVKCAPSWV